MKDKVIEQTAEIIARDLNLSPNFSGQGLETLEDIKTRLEPVIGHLLDHEFERLLQVLYRIDVDEDKVREVLTQSTPGKIAREITDLVIERQRQKIITRNWYGRS